MTHVSRVARQPLGGDWHSKIARKVAKKHAVPFVEVVDIFLPRGSRGRAGVLFGLQLPMYVQILPLDGVLKWLSCDVCDEGIL